MGCFKMKKYLLIFTVSFLYTFFLVSFTFAHFQYLIPSDDMVTADESKSLKIDLVFGHPFEGHFMNMDRPENSVWWQGEKRQT